MLMIGNMPSFEATQKHIKFSEPNLIKGRRETFIFISFQQTIQ